ncbi:hypothetical protein ACF0H5_001338 [Mactra antiquata]
MTRIGITLLLFVGIFVGYCQSFPTKPKALSVDCRSKGNNDEFKRRLKLRKNAEDQTTIWLFKGEELSIHFHLPQPAMIDILDVRYSNDGGVDRIGLSLDDVELGTFKTVVQYGWGMQWNHFESSGHVGNETFLDSGNHKLTITVLDSDPYGVEIDYIRFNVHGSRVDHLDRDHFMCIHNPPDKNGKPAHPFQ